MGKEVKRYLTPGEVAAILRVSPRTVGRWVQNGRLPGLRIGRIVRVPRGDLERFLAQRTRKVKTKGSSFNGQSIKRRDKET